MMKFQIKKNPYGVQVYYLKIYNDGSEMEYRLDHEELKELYKEVKYEFQDEELE